jgi:hypothetical protein
MSKQRAKLDLINDITLNLTKAYVDSIKLKEHVDELKTASSGLMGEQDKALDCVAQALQRAKEHTKIIDMLLAKNDEMHTLLRAIANAHAVKDIETLEILINQAQKYISPIIT